MSSRNPTAPPARHLRTNFSTDRGSKYPARAIAAGDEQVLHVIRRAAAEEALAVRGTVGLFRPAGDRGRQVAPDAAPQEVFLGQPPELHPGRQRGGELHDSVIEKREPPLHRVRHGDPVPLRGEDVARQ